jgi:chromosome segregation ATPase
VLGPGTASQESSTDLHSTTADLLQSASALRVSVEERVNGKAYSYLELQNQLDEYQRSYDELWKEVNELNALEKRVESSILFNENFMFKPEISV